MIKKLAQSIREYKKPTILTTVFIVLEVILDVLIPFVTSSLISEGIEKSNMSAIFGYGGLLIGMAIVALLFGSLSGSFCATASSGFAKNLRHDMFCKIQNFSFYNIDKFSTTSLVTRLTTDVSFVQNAFQMITRIAIRSPMMLILAISMTISISPKISLVFLCVSPVLIISLLLILSKVKPIFEKVIKEYDDLNSVVQENVKGIRVVKSFVREDHEIKKFHKISNVIYKDYSFGRKILAFNSPIMQFCVYTCIILISWLGAKTIVSSGGTVLTTGQLTALFTYTMQILSSLMILSMVFVSISISVASAKRIVEVLDEVPNIKNCENPCFEVKNGDIEFDNVNFSYTNDSANFCLKDVNLKIKSGETVGILGNTGSAKSTLVSLIPRLYDTTSGEIKVGGKNVKEYDIETLRNAVSMVLQKNVLFSGTIKENLLWGNENASQEQIEHACKVACATEFIETFEKKYDTQLSQGGTNVSGGQKQRLCIARALLKSPKILILDDSTSAVDTKTDRLIRNAFKEELPDTTKIIISQRVSSIKDADKIILLENGKITDCGTHKKLLKTNKLYKDIYLSQTTKKGGKD